MKNTEFKDLDIIIPTPIKTLWSNKELVIEKLLEQHNKYGFTRFALASPGLGWRSIGYPPREHYIECANLLMKLKMQLNRME